MINKIAASAEAALSSVADNAPILISGFGTAGIPEDLIEG
jgi:3-oxoadipate CoA-transferase alpha subunit